MLHPKSIVLFNLIIYLSHLLLNRAIDFATDEEATEVIAARAKCLSDWKKYLPALQDIHYLISSSSQSNPSIELEHRKYKCLSSLATSLKYFKPEWQDKAEGFLENGDLHGLEKLNFELSSALPKEDKLSLSEHNGDHPNFASCVGVRSTSLQGRHTVALRSDH